MLALELVNDPGPELVEFLLPFWYSETVTVDHASEFFFWLPEHAEGDVPFLNHSSTMNCVYA